MYIQLWQCNQRSFAQRQHIWICSHEIFIYALCEKEWPVATKEAIWVVKPNDMVDFFKGGRQVLMLYFIPMDEWQRPKGSPSASYKYTTTGKSTFSFIVAPNINPFWHVSLVYTLGVSKGTESQYRFRIGRLDVNQWTCKCCVE